jgi:hypothetical protein
MMPQPAATAFPAEPPREPPRSQPIDALCARLLWPQRLSRRQPDDRRIAVQFGRRAHTSRLPLGAVSAPDVAWQLIERVHRLDHDTADRAMLAGTAWRFVGLSI